MPAAVARSSILIVEDDSALRSLYCSHLRQAGYSVVPVEDGLAALHAMEAQRPDAVVLDLGLPRLSGRDVLREMKSHCDTQDIPVIVVTGTDTKGLSKSDFDCVLRKPIHLDTLLEAVENCLRRRRQG